jgi:PAS domain S-box-containing protein
MDVENNSVVDDLTSRLGEYNSFLNLVDTIIVIVDENKVIRLINDKLCSVLGYEKNEMIGKTPTDFALPSDKERIIFQMENLLVGKINPEKDKEVIFLTKNGQQRIIKWNSAPIKDDAGKIVFLLVSGEDITEQKKEARIQLTVSLILAASNSEANIDELFKYIHASVKKLMPAENLYIALYDKDNNEIRFAYFVDKYDKIAPTKRFGKGLTEYIINTGKSLLVDEQLTRELENKGEVELLGSPSKIWLGVPLTIQEEIIGVLVVQDYEDEKTYGEKEKQILELISYPVSRAIERKLQEHEREDLINKLQKMNASKDSLFSLISHDLRAPFNSLLGFSEILANEYDTLTKDEIKEYQSFIYDTSKNLYGMTTNLLQFSRFQMGRTDFDPEPLDIKKILNYALNILRGNTIKKQINVISTVPEDIKVFADEDMLKSILQNLLSNAIKFTRKGGDIYISVNRIDEDTKMPMLEIAIKDTGVGMPDELMESLFVDHVQSSPGTEREYGSGLGLLLVKEFVEKNGGHISVKSKINQGSTFTFTLPLMP